jgi:hypothetical protein
LDAGGGGRRWNEQVRRLPEKSSRDLFVEAFQAMRQSVDKDFDPADIETIYIGNFSSDLFNPRAIPPRSWRMRSGWPPARPRASMTPVPAAVACGRVSGHRLGCTMSLVGGVER